MPVTRREFVQQAAATSLTIGAGVLALSAQESLWGQDAKSKDSALPIIDTHQHLWDLDKFRLPWLGEAPALKRSYVTKDYLQEVQGVGVVKAVYMEVDVEPEQQVEEAEHILSLTKRPENLTVGAVISGRPASPKFRNYITAYRDNPGIKGVRQVLHGASTPPGTCLAAEYIAGIRLLGELGKSFDLCMRAKELGDAVKLVDACPDTRFVVDHCGNADPKAFPLGAKRAEAGAKPGHDAAAWQRDMEALAKRKNVICKISGIIASSRKGNWGADELAPIVNHCLNVFGPDRVVFGSDWPVCTLTASLREWVVALRSIIAERPLADQRKLLSENAARFYAV